MTKRFYCIVIQRSTWKTLHDHGIVEVEDFQDEHNARQIAASHFEKNIKPPELSNQDWCVDSFEVD